MSPVCALFIQPFFRSEPGFRRPAGSETEMKCGFFVTRTLAGNHTTFWTWRARTSVSCVIWFALADMPACHLLHRDSDKRLRNKSKSGHEERDLATQKCLVAGGNGRAFDAKYLLDF